MITYAGEMACSLLCLSRASDTHSVAWFPYPQDWTYVPLLTTHPPSSPGLDRLPLPVSGFPRASRKTQHQ